MTQENIFSGLKVVDLSSFIAGPSAAVILSDFGADVIKVEGPHGDPWRLGNRTPIQPQSDEAYQFHLANRNKRGLVLDLKNEASNEVLRKLVEWADVLIVNTPHQARKHLGLEFESVSAWNPRLIYADLTGFGEAGPDASLPGFDITAYWARSGLLSLTRDEGAPPTLPVSGSGDNATAVGLYAAIVTALYRRERTGEGAYVTTSLLAQGVWSASVSIQAALADARFPSAHDRMHPASAAMNVYRAADGAWFVLILRAPQFAEAVAAMGRSELAADPRFVDAPSMARHMSELSAIFDETFAAQPMAHWHDLFAGLGVTFGEIRGPADVIADPQLAANEIVVPLTGGGSKLTSTINSPFKVHGVSKIAAHAAPAIGQHTDQVLAELGFDGSAISRLRDAGAVPSMTGEAA